MTKLICIDAGHGCDPQTRIGDPGATNGGLWESAATLATAKILSRELKAAGFEVVMTRENNDFVTLKERCDIANRAGADLFVSIHCNSSENREAQGIETWRHPSTSQKAIAENVQRRMIEATGARDRGVKDGNFYVLRHTKAPAILCEIGFISHTEESVRLFKTYYQTRIAKAIAQGIIDTVGN